MNTKIKTNKYNNNIHKNNNNNNEKNNYNKIKSYK